MAGSKAVQVLEILKKISDESHPVTQAELLEAMRNMDGVAATENPGGIFARTSSMSENLAGEGGMDLGRQVSFIQKAINDKVRIGFCFNDYDADKNLIPRGRKYGLNPYYIVVYHDMHYLIAICREKRI